MRKLQYIIPLFFILLSCGESKDSEGIVYVQNMKLYSEFDLAIELDSELQAFSKERTRELDSLMMALENLTAQLERMEEIPTETYQSYNDLRNAVMYREKNYEEELIGLTQKYDQQIWERINGFTKTFAEENNYDMILGASGDGSLMYAKDTLDVTDELILFCNNNYNGLE